MVLIDLHSHSTISDGSRSIEDMVAAADRRGYTAYAVTDHVYGSDQGYRDVAVEVRVQIDRLRPYTAVQLFAGVELSDFEPQAIAAAATEARRSGAQVVVVHGECVSMPVLAGTNAAAVRAVDVDILAHPGLITEADAEIAARNGVFLELSARVGHCWANGHVFKTAQMTGAALIVDSDAHDEAGLLTLPRYTAVARGAGASELSVHQMRDRLAPFLVQALARRGAALV